MFTKIDFFLNNINPQNTLTSFNTSFIVNFRNEKVDNKIYGAVCIVFGIENKNYVKRTDSNSYLGQQSCVTGPCPRFVWVGG